MTGQHAAPKEPTHLGRKLTAVGLMGTAAAGSVGLLTSAAAAPEPVPTWLAPADASSPLPEDYSSPAGTTTVAIPTTYMVERGDWLTTISARFGISAADLYLANRDKIGGDPDLIFPGQLLTIPSTSVATVQPVATPQHAAPYSSPVDNLRITQSFRGDAHRGIDIGVPVGTPGYAVADGVVLASGPATGFGLWTVVRSQVDGQPVDFVYGHMDHLLVEAGQTVHAGDHIIDTGNNGQSTGPHLHFEVWMGGRAYGHPVDPFVWLAQHGIN